jgi:hypothetical protein
LTGTSFALCACEASFSACCVIGAECTFCVNTCCHSERCRIYWAHATWAASWAPTGSSHWCYSLTMRSFLVSKWFSHNYKLNPIVVICSCSFLQLLSKKCSTKEHIYVTDCWNKYWCIMGLYVSQLMNLSWMCFPAHALPPFPIYRWNVKASSLPVYVYLWGTISYFLQSCRETISI